MEYGLTVRTHFHDISDSTESENTIAIIHGSLLYPSRSKVNWLTDLWNPNHADERHLHQINSVYTSFHAEMSSVDLYLAFPIPERNEK